jgi:hypothetical protein
MVTQTASSVSLRSWKKESTAIRTQNDISLDYKGYTDLPGVRLVGVPKTQRAADILNICWALRLKSTKGTAMSSSKMKQGFWQDLSQSLTFGQGLAAGLGGTLCTGNLWYSFEKDTVVDGYDCLALQGWPQAFCANDTLSNSEKKELAGEGYHLACFATVATGMYLCPFMPWWKP